jgi:hypothetical protein
VGAGRCTGRGRPSPTTEWPSSGKLSAYFTYKPICHLTSVFLSNLRQQNMNGWAENFPVHPFPLPPMLRPSPPSFFFIPAYNK